tara:strand:- start:147 stop:2312 length:2166 start_codon:yes stop_codon:yes gene_type:complete
MLMDRTWFGAACGLIIGHGWSYTEGFYGTTLLLLLAYAGVYLCKNRPLGLGVLVVCVVLPQCANPPPVHPKNELSISKHCDVMDTIYRGVRSESTLKCEAMEGLVSLRQGRYSARYHPGQRIYLKGTLKAPISAQNPGEFDPRQVGLETGVMWTFEGRTKAVDGAETMDFATNLKLWFRNALDEGERGYGRLALKGMLLGERHAVPRVDIEAFRATGTGHLLAVSGLHIGALCWSVWWLLSLIGIKMKLIYPSRMAAFAALIAVWTLVFLAQSPVSATRAALMLSLALFARIIGWQTHILRLVAVALVATVCASPVNLINVGFQYSFLTVLSLSLITTKISKNPSAITISITASAAAWVVECWHFGTLTFSAPICNLILIPIASVVIVPLGLLGILVSPLSQQPLDFVSWITELFLGLAGGLADFFGQPMIVGRHWSPIVLAILVVSLVRLNWWHTILVTTAMIGVTLYEKPNHTYIDFVYVGQGDSTLLVSNGSAALVDTGGEYDVRRLLGHLSRQGIKELDWVLITHHHPDHYGGLKALAKTIHIKHIFHSPTGDEGSHWTEMVSTVDGLSLKRPNPFQTLGEFTIQNLFPTENRNASENDRSIALRVTRQHSSLMLTGDLESFGERRLVAMGIPPSDVLQLGHHGSRTSSIQAFLNAVSPKLAIASCGLNNRYGFPHGDVVKRLKSNGTRLLSTSTNGWIRLIPLKAGWTALSLRSSN